MNNPCLVVIDVQEKLFPVMNNNVELLKNIKILVKGFQLYNLPILVTEQVPDKLGKTIDPINSLFDKLDPIIKSSFSCVNDPNFLIHIDSLIPSEIILAGIETHVCVYQTAMDLIDQGRHVEIITNAVSSRNLDNHSVALNRMDKYGAFLSTVEMLLFDIQKKAGGERFKELVKLVK